MYHLIPSITEAVKRRERNGPVPLSFAQQRLWFLHQLEPASNAYNISSAVRLEGPLNCFALRRTVAEIVRRHEVLRTRIDEHGGQPEQIIEPFAGEATEGGRLKVIPVAEANVRSLVEEEATMPFDLVRGPLFRVWLLAIRSDEHILLLTMHHIVSDGWSMGVLIREVTTLYNAFDQGLPSPLPDLPIQYADYAIWQREYLARDVLEAEVGYWKERLRDAAILDLPTDHARPAASSYRGSKEGIELGKELSDSLRRLSQREGATLFMVLIAAFKVLLMRYSGEEDVSVGTVIANRTRRGVEGLIGFFVNTLVLRTDLGGNPSFRELIRREREVALGAYTHREVPFEKLVEEINPERDLSRNPLFQVMMVLQNAGRRALEIGGLKVSGVEEVTGIAKFDLTLDLAEGREEIVGSLEYSEDLFERESIRRMARHYERVVGELVRDAEQRIGEIGLLSEVERRQVVEEWNETEREYGETRLVHEMFAEQAERSPEAVALICGEEQVSYCELNERADRLAHYLRRLGVGPEVRVGVCLERSLEMVVGLLGVLKAGGAYLPLDSECPEERLAWMVEDAQAAVLLTRSHLVERLAGLQARTVCLDKERERIASQSSQAPPSGVSADNLAYVIYTSGSTGRPKGAAVYHRGVANLLHWFITEFEISADDCVLLISSFNFDLTQKNVFAPLMTGATLCLSHYRHYDPAGVRQEIREQGATLLNCTPSTFYPLVEEKEESAVEDLNSLRLVFLGGEPIAMQSVWQWLTSAHCQAELVNTYGPTECTDISTYYRVERPEQFLDRAIPIGRPIYNSQAFILGSDLGLLPVGVVGELCIEGEGVGAGYLNNAELTSEKFVPDPFSERGGERLYRTGDRVRYWPDGNLEFLGRWDEQVKVRGYRIEIGEIEAALNEHPSVRQSAVIANEDERGGKRLVGYVVGEEEVTVTELKKHVRERLPEYMVPEAILVVEEMPLTANGKIDRKRLPLVPLVRVGEGVGEQERVGVRTPVEEMLVGIFEEVLRVDRVGIADNFFEMGGHSLLATQVIARVRSVFGVEIGVKSIFEEKTVEGLARRVEEAIKAGRKDPPPLVRVSREGEKGARLPLSFAQQRLWFLDQLLPNNPLYNSPGAVRLEGKLDLGVLESVINEIVRRHEVLRTRIEVEEGEPVQVIDEWERRRLEVEDLRGVSEGEREEVVRRMMREEAEAGFDLSRGPLLRVKVLQLGEEDHVVLFTMHHIVSDAWSLVVLVREVRVLYEAISGGKRSPLPELEIQYADYASWQRSYLKGEVLEEELEYWKRQLGGEPRAVELPTDRPRPAVASYRGASVAVRIELELLKQLEELGRQQGVTLFMTLLAAFQIVLARWSGQQDIAVGTDVANRTRSELEPLIGFFVNQLVLRTDLSGDPTVEQLLARVRETCLEAYQHQDVPFERLVEDLNPVRSLSHAPLFQAKLMMQNVPGIIEPFADIAVEALGGARRHAQIDLQLNLERNASAMVGECIYATSLFDEATVRRLVKQWLRVLESMAGSGTSWRVADLAILDEVELRQVTEGWNQTGREVAASSVVELLEAHAAARPEFISIVFGDQSLSYGELNARSNQLAGYLSDLGVGPEVRIGIYLERSLDLLVAVWGVLKAGGAYVPLDPEYPSERLAYMHIDAQTPVLLTVERLAGRLPVSWAQVVCLDREQQRIAAYSGKGRRWAGTAENAAYVIYTSGSTGWPKGVVVTHGALANFVIWMRDSYGLDSRDRVLHKTAFGFDVAMMELFWPVEAGAALVVAEPGGHRDLDYVAELMKREAVTAGYFVASSLPLFVDTLRQGDGGTLRHMICGAEALPTASHERFRALLGGCQLHNIYGPTETTIGSTAWTCRDDWPWPMAPIGGPIANTQVYLLDGEGRPAPVGVRGELYIGGAGVARGYLNRPELTAERFVPNPYGEGRRLYRTGDLARWRAEGEMEFLGRADQQVKVRGYRVETGEIESALREQAGVQEAAVVIREGRLVAYLVGQGAKAPSIRELRGQLQQRLPEYMIPTAWMTLERLPVSPNGKLDRKALPDPEQASVDGDRYQAPGTAVEELLCGIWGRALGVERVGIHDNFFDLGGHSLLGTQVVTQARQMFGIELELRRLFETPTVAGVAEAVERARRAGRYERAPALAPVDRSGGVPLSFAQQRLWFIDQLEPGSVAYNLPLAVRLRGDLEVEALRRTLAELVRRHEVLRTHIELREGEAVQVIEPYRGQEQEGERLRVSRVRREEVAEVVAQEAVTAFDLSRGPLLRARLLQVEEEREEQVLLVTMHHIVSDGWSLGVLVREVAALYEAYAGGGESPLAELPIQYGDFAVWQREWLQGEVLEGELEYWRKQLAGVEELKLPLDHPRPAVESHRGAQQAFLLETDLVAGLKELIHEEGATLFMLLLAAFQTLLYRYTGQEDIVVGTPAANRNRLELEGMIGFFVNTLAMRARLSSTISFRDLLHQVRETALAVYSHDQAPFEKLVEELSPKRAVGQNPLLHAWFFLDNTDNRSVNNGSILSRMSLFSGVADFVPARLDLALTMTANSNDIKGAFTYAADLFEPETINTLIGRFLSLLRTAVRDPDCKLLDIPLTDVSESRQTTEIHTIRSIDEMQVTFVF
jgi:amino acid adenylation domain-containing protein